LAGFAGSSCFTIVAILPTWEQLKFQPFCRAWLEGGGEGGVSASTQNQALAAILFLYGNVLQRELGQLSNVVHATSSAAASSDDACRGRDSLGEVGGR
jgi:hypothetical protein